MHPRPWLGLGAVVVGGRSNGGGGRAVKAMGLRGPEDLGAVGTGLPLG